MNKLTLFPLVLTLFATSMADDLLVEGFESGSLPDGWQVWEEGDHRFSWYFNYSDYSHSGYYAALRYYGLYLPPYYGGDDSWLVTPTLDLSGYDNIEFSCWCLAVPAGWNPVIRIMGSDVPSPTASDFAQFLYLNPPPYYYWKELVADASEFDNESDVTFAIRYQVYDGPEGVYYDTIWIDDVLVTDDSVTVIEAATLGEIKAIYR